MKRMIMAVVVGLACSGCALLKQEAKTRVDLGDGMVFDVIPVGAAVAGANAVAPGSGEVLKQIEARLAAQREAKLGPFNGLPFTTSRSVILKNGTVITEAEIAKIVETLTPIVPAAVTRVIEPADFKFQISDGGLGTNETSNGTHGTDGTNAVSTDAVGALLEKIGGGP